MAAILNYSKPTTSGSVHSIVSVSGKAKNMKGEVGIAAPSVIVQKLFPLPVLLTVILNFGSLPSSANVGQRRPTSGSVLYVKSKSGVVEKLGTAFQIASQSSTVQMLFPVPVWWPPS
jgi:hypothetical protein